MDVRTEYRDYGRKALVKAIKTLEGLEIRVGVQGRTGYRAVQQRVFRAAGARSAPEGGQPKDKVGGRRRVRPRRGPQDEPNFASIKKRRRAVIRTVQGLRVVDLATIHEFGSPKARIPARSFLRSTFRTHFEFIRKLQRRVVDAALAGRDPVPAAVQLGLRVEAGVKKTITDLRTPPLAPSTKARRYALTGDMDPNPLVDTGQLRASITSVVLRKGRRVGGIAMGGDIP